VPLDEALGRVTARPVWARLSSPGYHASAMDGYAVRSADTLGATETAPVRLKLDDQAQYVDTGDPLPAWADAVIMIEQTQLIGHEATGGGATRGGATGGAAIEIQASVAPWSSVRPMGEDMVATELVLPANHVLAPVDLGAIAGCGCQVTCGANTRGVIPTGTELVTAEQVTQTGQAGRHYRIQLAGAGLPGARLGR
jgi:putative molybdopterin biosynthesis protein